MSVLGIVGWIGMMPKLVPIKWWSNPLPEHPRPRREIVRHRRGARGERSRRAEGQAGAITGPALFFRLAVVRRYGLPRRIRLSSRTLRRL